MWNSLGIYKGVAILMSQQVIGKCMECGKEYVNCKFCTDCGGIINNIKNYKKCTFCGGIFPKNWSYCSNDGEKLE